MKKLFSVLLCALLLCGVWSVPASANSAQMHWQGTSATGAVVREENCPLVVEKEVLTLDAPEFPEHYYDSAQKCLDYPGKVTAEYTFHNPADYAVTATLAFPFGEMPDYGYLNTGEAEDPGLDNEKFGVAVNGGKVEAELRHTLSFFGEEFSVEKDLPLLLDDYGSDEFFSPDMTVTEYAYRLVNDPGMEYSVTFKGFLYADDTKTRLYTPDLCGMQNGTEEGANVDVYPKDGVFRLYAIGEPLEEEPVWHATWRQDSSAQPLSPEPDYKPLSTRTMTFREFALFYRPEGSEVSDLDWYNATMNYFQHGDCAGGVVNWFDDFTYLPRYLMRWYQYELTLAPGETLTNTVTAPLYPAIDTSYEPPVYDYSYLLSPAKTWAEFGPLEIHINTPFAMTDSSLERFEQTDEGYALSLPGLPDEELTFTLSAEERPKRSVNSGSHYFVFWLLNAAVYVVIGLAVVLAAVLIVRLILSRKKRKKQP